MATWGMGHGACRVAHATVELGAAAVAAWRAAAMDDRRARTACGLTHTRVALTGHCGTNDHAFY